MTTSDLLTRAREGADKLISHCLALRTGDHFTLFSDESTNEPAQLILAAATHFGLQVRHRHVSIAEQVAFAGPGHLPLDDLRALDGARAVITCLSNHTEGTRYRRELVQVGTTGGRRLGHMPGADVALLANSVNIDYTLALSRCDDLALALTLGQRASLRTYAPAHGNDEPRQFELTFELGGLDRSPITSTGVIPLGTWGNLPGGETFIAPIEDTANGTFVLNGAFKNYVLRPSQFLLLHFSRGRLEQIEGAGEARDRFESILAVARSRSDDDFRGLAELGIGVNPGISELTGNALFDEKCYGTAHIAIGDSTRYGGSYYSDIHEDLITNRPSIFIDDHLIVDQGRFAFDPADWRDVLSETPVDPRLFGSNGILTRTTLQAEIGPDEQLRVHREVTAGRICVYTVGALDSSRLLGRLYQAIPSPGDGMRLNTFVEQAERDLSLIRFRRRQMKGGYDGADGRGLEEAAAAA